MNCGDAESFECANFRIELSSDYRNQGYVHLLMNQFVKTSGRSIENETYVGVIFHTVNQGKSIDIGDRRDAHHSKASPNSKLRDYWPAATSKSSDFTCRPSK